MHVKDDEGRLFFNLVMGGESVDSLCAEVRRTVARIAAEHRFNPEFGGTIRIDLVPSLTPRSEALRGAMDALVDELGSQLERDGTKTAAREPIRLSWSLREHDLAP